MIVNTIVAFASLCAFVALAYGPWQATCTDIARQYCFAKRDALFDIAMSGEIDFRSNEYRAMRLSLEKTIRYCHELSIFKLVLFGLDRSSLKKEGDVYLSTLSRSAARVADPELRKKLESMASDVEMFLVLVVYLKSPMLWILTPALAVLVFSLLIFDLTKSGFLRLVRGIGEKAQVQAECA